MRLSFDPSHFQLTAHCLQRMQERHVSTDTVRDTLSDGYLDRRDTDLGRLTLRHRDLGVRVVVDPVTCWVVTVLPPEHRPTSCMHRHGTRPVRTARRRRCCQLEVMDRFGTADPGAAQPVAATRRPAPAGA